jgi:hypothetical protein
MTGDGPAAGDVRAAAGDVRAPGDEPFVRDVSAKVYVIPTDAPEADGTLAWNETTMVLVRGRAGGEQEICWSYAAAAAGAVVTDVLAPHGGILTPDPAAPGLGLRLRATDAERYRRG